MNMIIYPTLLTNYCELYGNKKKNARRRRKFLKNDECKYGKPRKPQNPGKNLSNPPFFQIQFCSDDVVLASSLSVLQEGDRAREGGELRRVQTGSAAQDSLGSVRVSGLFERGKGAANIFFRNRLYSYYRITEPISQSAAWQC